MFDKAFVVHRALAAANLANTRWQSDLCTAFARIAGVAREPNEAARYLGDVRAIYGQLQQGNFFRDDIQFAQLGAALDQLTARISTVSKR